MELTKEHFDHVVKGLATKEDLTSLATKEQIDELARITSTGFEDIQKRFDVTAQLKTFERKFQKLEEALHIKL